MKTLPCILLAGLISGLPLRGATDAGGFNSVRPDYKKEQELPDTFFNPFKVQSTAESDLQKKDSATITNEAISDALSHRGISGVIYASRDSHDRVIIGDQVFGVGDELTFPNDAKDAPDPLVTGANVVLREVGTASLSFDVTPEGEPARRMNFPLRAFWHP
jgi:hypothetical protein